MKNEPKFYYEEFCDFWKVICERNPDKAGKLVLMSFDELKDWTRQVFFGARRIMHKEGKTDQHLSGFSPDETARQSKPGICPRNEEGEPLSGSSRKGGSIEFCKCKVPIPEISTDMRFMYCEKCKKWIRPKTEKGMLALKAAFSPSPRPPKIKHHQTRT